MFLDEKNEWRQPEEPRRGRALSAREEKLVLWLVGINAFALLIAPFGQASVIQAVLAFFVAN